MRYILLICFILISCSGWSQQSLSLRDALRIGLLNNLGIRIADQKVELSEVDQKVFRSSILPRIDFSGRQNNLYEVDNSPTSFVDGNYTQSNAKGTINVSWVLFDGYKAKVETERLQQMTNRSNGAAQLVVENTTQAIYIAYYRALLEQNKWDVIKQVTGQSLNRYTRNKLLYDKGSSSLYDLLRLEKAWIKDSINYHNQELIHANALDDLKFQVGLKTDKSIVLTDQLNIATKNYRLSALHENLVSNNQDIKMQYMNLELQVLARKRLKADKYPTIKINSSLSQDINASRFKGEERRKGSNFDYFAGFTIDYNLYEGGRTRQLLKQSNIQEKIALLELEQLEYRLKDELNDAYTNYTHYQSIITKQNQLLNVVEKSLSIAKDRLDGGYATPLEYRSVQLDYLESKLDLLETVFRLKSSEIRMIRLTGGISRSSFD